MRKTKGPARSVSIRRRDYPDVLDFLRHYASRGGSSMAKEAARLIRQSHAYANWRSAGSPGEEPFAY